jgi:hypothetical protein
MLAVWSKMVVNPELFGLTNYKDSLTTVINPRHLGYTNPDSTAARTNTTSVHKNDKINIRRNRTVNIGN